MDKYELAEQILRLFQEQDVDPAIAGEACALVICATIKMIGGDEDRGAAAISRMIRDTLAEQTTH